MYQSRRTQDIDTEPIENIAHITPQAKIHLEQMRYRDMERQEVFEKSVKSLEYLSETYPANRARVLH